MGIGIWVSCNCWERGLCKPCPIDMKFLNPPDAKIDWLSVKIGLPLPLEEAQAVNQAFDAWRATACEHPGGSAFSGRLGSYSFAGHLEKDIAHLTTSDDSVLFRVMEDLNLANQTSNDCQDSDFILEDLDRLNAPDPLDPFWAGVKMEFVHEALKCIRDAAAMSVAMQKNMHWG
jgi:hypothetical protein